MKRTQKKTITPTFEWVRQQKTQDVKRELLISKDRKVRVMAAAVLWETKKSREGLPVLIQAFCSKEEDLQLTALYALGLMRQPAQQAFLKILKEGKHKSHHPRIIRFLGEHATKATLASLKDYVNSDDKEVANSAIRAFAMSDVYDMEKQWGKRELVITSELVAPTLTVIVHGTWPGDWWQWPKEFPSYLDQQTHDVYKGQHPFVWSGDNTYEARTAGGVALLRWMQEHPTEKLRVVAHSHGGNVAFEASRLGLDIHTLILLGTPIRNDHCPDSSKINRIYNIYSLQDEEQLWGSYFEGRGEGQSQGRILPEAVENIQVRGEHLDLHTDPLWKQNKLERILSAMLAEEELMLQP